MQFLQSHYKKALLFFIIITFLTLNFLPQTQKISQSYIDNSLQRTLLSFGIAKGLNAIISVAQGTEIAATPAGIGVNFSVGELLDPINDMVERFSWVMLASSVSLGIQKILLAIVSSLYIQVALLALALVFMYAFLSRKKALANLSLKMLLFILILRFSLPLFALINQNIYENFLSPSYETSTLALEETSIAAQELQKEKVAKDLSMWGKVKQAYKNTANALNIKKQIQDLTQKLNDTFSHILNLITLFIIETIISPLLFLYLLLRLFKVSGFSTKNSDYLIQLFRDKTHL